MYITVTLKCPDVLDDTLREHSCGDEETYKRLKRLADKWFLYGELLVVVIDSDAQTIKVVER